MYKNLSIFAGTIILLLMSACNETKVQPPVAEKIPHEHEKHGVNRVDDYYWMNQRDDQKVLDYLNAENAYSDAMMDGTEEVQDKLFNEIKGRIKEDDQSVPYLKNGYYYYSRYELGKQYPIYCRKKGSLEAEEEIMLNVNEMAEGFSYYQLGGFSLSTDNNILAYGVDTVSRRQYTIFFKNLSTGEILDTKIPNTTGSVAWANDNETVFYTVKDETLRPYKIFRHSLKDVDATKDAEIYHESDETFRTFVYKTKSEEYLIIGSESTMATEYRFMDANKPKAEFKMIQPRKRGIEYKISHFGDKFYIVTNYEAKNFRLMEAPVSNPGIKNWKELIPNRDKVFLEGIDIFNDYLVVEERNEGLIQLNIKSWDGKVNYFVEFDEEVYTAYTTTNVDFNTKWLRYGYNSMTTPASTFEFNMETKERKLLKQKEVLDPNFDPANYETKRLWAKAEDGTLVPMSIVYKKGLELNGSNPTLLYAYGSYGATMDPYFSVARLSLLDRGFVFALAHIRGGQYLGRSWYEDGKLLKKKNTFTDFIDCGKYLIEQEYTNSENLVGMGGSAGGLLMGAVANMSPELFKGIVAQVPFVDVVTTMLDESIPLTTGEYDEWGNPNDKAYFDYMLSYSPYDQVSAQSYPNMLITTGYHDSQVQYWEPAKWVAKLRDLKTDDNLLIFKTEMEFGHGGASGRFDAYKEIAYEYAFMFKILNVQD